MDTFNDFLTLGVVGKSVGLVEFEQSSGTAVSKRSYFVVNPLSANKFTGTWTPPLTKIEIIQSVSESQGVPSSAVLAFQNGGNNSTLVFASKVAGNSFGPLITVKDPFSFLLTCPSWHSTARPIMPYWAPRRDATVVLPRSVWWISQPAPRSPSPDSVLSIASPSHSQNGIACTTTEDDFSVEFYNLANPHRLHRIHPRRHQPGTERTLNLIPSIICSLSARSSQARPRGAAAFNSSMSWAIWSSRSMA